MSGNRIVTKNTLELSRIERHGAKTTDARKYGRKETFRVVANKPPSKDDTAPGSALAMISKNTMTQAGNGSGFCRSTRLSTSTNPSWAKDIVIMNKDVPCMTSINGPNERPWLCL